MWDLFYKLGFPINFYDCSNVVFALSMAFSLFVVKNYEKDIPSYASKVMKMIYKDISE